MVIKTLDPELDLDSHWPKCWIRIRIETNADPQHCKKESRFLFSLLILFQGDTKPRRIPTPILGTGPTGYNIVMVALGAKVFISLFN